jgi:hypothetical protein
VNSTQNKFDEICQHVATMGYGDLSTLSPEPIKRVSDEAEELVEQWHDEVEILPIPSGGTGHRLPSPVFRRCSRLTTRQASADST